MIDGTKVPDICTLLRLNVFSCAFQVDSDDYTLSDNLRKCTKMVSQLHESPNDY
jgi:hypothetical protein